MVGTYMFGAVLLSRNYLFSAPAPFRLHLCSKKKISAPAPALAPSPAIYYHLKLIRKRSQWSQVSNNFGSTGSATLVQSTNFFYIKCSLPEHALPELLFHPQPGLEYEGDDGADLVFCVGMANNIGPRGSSKQNRIQ